MLGKVLFGSAVLAMLMLPLCNATAHEAVQARADKPLFTATHWREEMAMFDAQSTSDAALPNVDPMEGGHDGLPLVGDMAGHSVAPSAQVDRDDEGSLGSDSPNDLATNTDPVDLGGSAAGTSLSLLAVAAIACVAAF
ncbi:hypothetical protein H4R19_001386 [Coemansia spiralis]|nr:hypothetical protein H4R19_001386 [Coemansia spiralis]